MKCLAQSRTAMRTPHTCRTENVLQPYMQRRRAVEVRAFRSSQNKTSADLPRPSCNVRKRSASFNLPTDSQVSLMDAVAQSHITSTCLAGFCLIASGVFLPALSTDPSSMDSLLARSALLVGSSTGVAQAAAAAVPDTLLQASEASGAAELMPPFVAAVPSSPILNVDQAIHNFVTTHTSYSWRALAADIYISDSFICAGIAGWILCTAACLALDAKKSFGPLALSWAFYVMTCGATGERDPWLVDMLKHAFGRVRPSTLHHTFSFPSGHTSAAVFIVGGLVAVLLPLTMQLLASRSSRAGSNNENSNGSTESVGGSGSGLSMFDAGALTFWGAAWVTTAAGRVLADAHWLSDTLAGGLLSIAVVSLLAQCIKLYESFDGSKSSSSDVNE